MLTSLAIPNSVTNIGQEAFGSCLSLTSVTIGTGITSFGAGAFARCSNLTSVTFQGPIHSSAFRYSAGGYDYLRSPFEGDLLDKFYAADLTTGTPGTYTRTAYGTTWTKK
jgi:hypothetical protein